MFTGIVQTLGEIAAVEPQQDASRLHIRGDSFDGAQPGDSVSVDGVCLTVTSIDGDVITTDVMHETLRRTTLSSASPGQTVDLELAATPSSRLGGHIVQGHVDGVGRILDRRPSEHWELVDIELPEELTRYVVEKGSIAIDGVSLTVAAIANEVLTVSLIPETLRRTVLGRKSIGSLVNVEVDVIGKYVERLLAARLER
jgi:riboflavin synthase